MAAYTVDVVGTCGGGNLGEHIKLAIYRNGEFWKNVSVTKTEVLTNDLDWDQVMVFLLRAAIKKAGATTLAQAKTAVEAAEWVL